MHDKGILLGLNLLRNIDGLTANLVQGIRRIRNELTEKNFFDPIVGNQAHYRSE